MADSRKKIYEWDRHPRMAGPTAQEKWIIISPGSG